MSHCLCRPHRQTRHSRLVWLKVERCSCLVSRLHASLLAVPLLLLQTSTTWYCRCRLRLSSTLPRLLPAACLDVLKLIIPPHCLFHPVLLFPFLFLFQTKKSSSFSTVLRSSLCYGGLLALFHFARLCLVLRQDRYPPSNRHRPIAQPTSTSSRASHGTSEPAIYLE